MKELENWCIELKKNYISYEKDSSKPVSCWNEKDLISGKIVDAFVIILKTRGCSWAHNSGCSMCGYFNDSLWRDSSNEEIINQIDYAMEKFSNQSFVKIFTSGSFLDDEEINPDLRFEIIKKISKKAKKISFESRPEFITGEKITNIKNKFQGNIFEVGIGLETSSDYVRDRAINKGFTFSNYEDAALLLKKQGWEVKTYVLVKPPFLTEKQAIDDCIQTIKKIKNLTDTVSLNPTNVQSNTIAEYLWKRGQYRPPWLWSVVEILKNAKKTLKDVRIKCDVVGGGGIRGAHNCRLCDKGFLQAINEFSLNQDLTIFDDLNCECFDKWLDCLNFEQFGFGSLVDM